MCNDACLEVLSALREAHYGCSCMIHFPAVLFQSLGIIGKGGKCCYEMPSSQNVSSSPASSPASASWGISKPSCVSCVSH